MVTIIATALLYPLLPGQMVIHMNGDGDLGNYVPKVAAAWLILGMLLFELVLLNGVKKLMIHNALQTTYDYEVPSDENIEKAKKVKKYMITLKASIGGMLLFIHFFFLFVNMELLPAAIMDVLIQVLIGALFITLGIAGWKCNIPVNMPGWGNEQPDEVNLTVNRFTMIAFVIGGSLSPVNVLMNEPYTTIWMISMLGVLPIIGIIAGVIQGNKQWKKIEGDP
ncbi:nicotinamide riboside transporter PnuC [Geomicrobium halophilum]|uniref:Nicotinamide riboside transporter PnuC n=2 Tax=Geomicrobium halophilum TaxID=549000 RepID=A0A841PQ89_9BACL|nr:nicotinamide riboside transporter PnuC [Geomicrobium halophilum]